MAPGESVEIFRKNLLERILLRWNTRHIGSSLERLILLFSVSIYFDKMVHASEISIARERLCRLLHDEEEVDRVMERVQMRIACYIKDYKEFLLDRERVFEMIAEDIQLYSIMRDIFMADGTLSESEEQAEEVIRRQYDRHWPSRGATPQKPAEKWE